MAKVKASQEDSSKPFSYSTRIATAADLMRKRIICSRGSRDHTDHGAERACGLITPEKRHSTLLVMVQNLVMRTGAISQLACFTVHCVPSYPMLVTAFVVVDPLASYESLEIIPVHLRQSFLTRCSVLALDVRYMRKIRRKSPLRTNQHRSQ